MEFSKITKRQLLGALVIILSTIGLYMSMLITVDKIELLENPDTDFGCSINEVISCKSVMESDQASVFGFPNPLLGIAGYSMMLVTGVLYLMPDFLNKLYLKLFNLGTLAGALFSLWLLYQSIFEIKALCPLCLVSYLCGTGIFILSTIFNIRYGVITFGGRIKWERDRKNLVTIFASFTFFVYFATFAVLFYKYDSDIFKLVNIEVYLP